MPADPSQHFAHASGLSDVSVTPDGQYIITVGADGLVQVFDGKSKTLQKPTIAPIEMHTEGANAVAVSPMGDTFATVSDDSTLALHLTSSWKFDQALQRSTLPLRCVSWSPTGSEIAYSGEDGVVKVTSAVDAGVTSEFKGHRGAVHCVAYDPIGDFIASSGADGTLRIWNRRSQECVKTFPNMFKQVDPALDRWGVTWRADGSELLVSGDTKPVIVARDSWKVKDRSFDEDHNKAVNIVTWSPNSLYVVTVGLDNSIMVWDYNSRTSVAKHRHDSRINGLKWHPTENRIVFIDHNGNVCQWNDVIAAHLTDPIKPVEDVVATTSLPNPASFFEDEAVDEDAKAGDDDESGMDTDDDSLIQEAAADGDVEAFKAKQAKREEKRRRRQEKQAALNAGGALSAAELGVPPLGLSQQLQPVFQPGATPIGNKRRFLAWNLLGSIVTRDDHTHSSVEIEFADAVKNRPIRFNDHYNFTMAAMSNAGAIFACPKTDAANSTLFFRPFKSWAGNSDWTVHLGDDEQVQAVACGDTWIAAATDTNYLRLFTIGGVQRAIIQLPGHLVCMVGDGDHLAIAYQNTGSGDLMFDLLDISTSSKVVSGPLPLSPEAATELMWLGFTDPGRGLVALDTTGRLRLLSLDFGTSWVPVLDLGSVRKSAAETHRAVGVTADQLICVVCKSADDYPSVLPRAVPSSISLATPVVPGGVAELEDAAMRARAFLSHASDADERRKQELAIDTTLIKIINAACKSEKGLRALDAAESLTFPRSANIAVQLAHANAMPVLAEKIQQQWQAKAERAAMAAAEMAGAYSDSYGHGGMASSQASTVPSQQQSENAALAISPLRKQARTISRKGVSAKPRSGGIPTRPPTSSRSKTSIPLRPSRKQSTELRGAESELDSSDSSIDRKPTRMPDPSSMATDEQETQDPAAADVESEDDAAPVDDDDELSDDENAAPAKADVPANIPANPFVRKSPAKLGGKKTLFSAIKTLKDRTAARPSPSKVTHRSPAKGRRRSGKGKGKASPAKKSKTSVDGEEEEETEVVSPKKKAAKRARDSSNTEGDSGQSKLARFAFVRRSAAVTE